MKNNPLELSIPALVNLSRWVAWREEIKNSKLTKIPYDPHGPGQARIPTDPATWGTREQAARRWHKLKDGGRKGGIGIVLGDLDDGYVLMGIDLDRCFYKSGRLIEWADEVVDRFDTYAEISPSNRGVKLFFLARRKDADEIDRLLGGKTRKAFNAGKHREIAIDRARYYAVTDAQLENTPDTFRVVDVEDIRWLIEDAGPGFLERYRPADDQGTTPRDESGSGHGFRFLQERKRCGDDYANARDALLADDGPAGEWARRKTERDLQRAWDRATVSKRKLTTRPLSSFEEREFEWLWEPFIPLGMVSIMFGDGGVGKSTVTYDIAARLTKEKSFPLGDDAVSGSVLILTKEDGIENVVKPRLRVAGADLDRVHIVGYEVPDNPEEFDPIDRLDAHLAELEEEIARLGDVALLLVDPVADFAGSLDMNKDADVRKLLQPLVQLARKRDLTVIAVLHINKNMEQAAQHRGTGSLAFRNVSRSALLVAVDPEDHDHRVMVQTKTNLTRGGYLALGFCIEQARDGKYTRIAWDDDLRDADPDVLLSKKAAKQTKGKRAKKLLTELLADGAIQVKPTIKDEARAAGISWETMKRARTELAVRAFQRGRHWWWEMR